MLTGPNGGQWFMMGDPIAEVLSKHVVPTSSRIGGGLTNIGSISKKQGDIAFSLSCFMEAARSGEEEYQSIDLSNATLMARIYPQVMYFLLRKDFAEEHGITDVESLLQKKLPLRFASLKPGTASEFLLGLLLKHGYNTGFDQLKEQGWEISFNNYAETADNFVSGDLDCFAYTAGTEVPLILTMEEHTDVIVLPIDAKVLDMLAERFNTETYVIQPGVYRSVTEPVNTLGDYTIIIVRKDLPDDMVYAINKALWEGRGYIAGVIKDFGKLSLKTALVESVPAHPGSARFWTELREKEGK
jgi:TRAP transporter TAXI family solute receptor